MLRNENPRPYLIRDSKLINLNGKWEFDFDDKNVGHKEKWFLNHKFNRHIIVPFPFESKLSEVEDVRRHDYIWYQKEFDLEVVENKRYILNFNGVDYFSEIYINNYLVSNHFGGSTRFKIDVTDFLVSGKNKVTVYVFDDGIKQDFPRGKQYWKDQGEGIFYTRTSGIYKNVYLEELNSSYIDEYYLTSDIDEGTLEVKLDLVGDYDKIEYLIKKDNKIINQVVVSKGENAYLAKEKLRVWNLEDVYSGCFHDEKLCWTPDNPCLYDLSIKLIKNEEVVDNISTYFAMRKVSYKNGMFFLNNRPFYQKLVLIQGYFKDGILAYKDIQDLENDIILAKKMGFNGGRMHQKIEDPYYYYLCDKLGFIAWLELPSCQLFNFNSEESILKEWSTIIRQNYNHPSIFVYVPLNESWGVPHLPSDKKQVDFENALYYLTHSLDSSRLCVGNDGWEMSKTDICSIHNYRHGEKGDLKANKTFEDSLINRENLLLSKPAGRDIFLDGYENNEVPVMLTEFGGVSFVSNKDKNWGYTTVKNKEDYLEELTRIFKAINKSTSLVGYCYTQLYDVEHEINGLLTYERKPKVDVEEIKKINDLVSPSIMLLK